MQTVIRTLGFDSPLPLWLASRGQRVRSNIVLICPPDKEDAAIAHLIDACVPPFQFCRMPGPLTLPTEKSGTLVVTTFTDLRLDQQLELYDWLQERPGTIQVIATANAFPQTLIHEGKFFEALYHDLSDLRIEIEPKRPAHVQPRTRWIDSVWPFRRIA